MEDQAKRVWVAGASGTVGNAVTETLLAQGHEAICLLRDNASGRLAAKQLCDKGAMVLWDHWPEERPDAVISCLASRSGSSKDAKAVDLEANLALLKAAEDRGVDHFILVSAICVQRPLLAFQQAKLVFEDALKASVIDHTIVRPTAFFKSLSGQVDRVMKGKPFLLFGDGQLTRCKPISDRDLAEFIVGCVTDPAARNKSLPVGGPGPAITLKQQGELLFEAAGKPAQFRSISPEFFTAAARVLSLAAPLSNWFAEKAEYARIAHYYATQSMLVFDLETQCYDADATPEFGEDTLLDHYKVMIAERLRAAE